MAVSTGRKEWSPRSAQVGQRAVTSDSPLIGRSVKKTWVHWKSVLAVNPLARWIDGAGKGSVTMGCRQADRPCQIR